MPVPLDASIEELDLAWRRAKADRPNRCFVEHPHLINWIEHDRRSWLEALQRSLAEGFNPQPPQLCLAPKPRFLVRPALVLEIRDEVVFNLIVGRLYAGISQRLEPLQGDPDVAYQLSGQPGAVEWIRSGFPVWKQWRLRSIGKLTPDISHAVVADIAGFYDNMDYGRLHDNLRRMAAPGEELRLLSECLNRWSHPRGKGVPQGYSASDILAKAYLWSFDERLLRDGYRHLRYVDDIRLFCTSKHEAKEVIERIAQLLHVHGLTVQSAKTEILSKADAANVFNGIQPTIAHVQRQLAAEIQEELEIGGEYLRAGQLSELLNTRGGEVHPEVLERAFTEYFPASGEVKFDKTLFHYLLTRLGKTQSVIAINYCIDALRSRPEETEYVLRYFSAVDLDPGQYERLIEYLSSRDSIYDYQRYQILLWHLQEHYLEPRLLDLSRSWGWDRNRPLWLRSVCIAYVAEHQNPADLELLEELYAQATNDVERADIVAALRNQERGRRNAFYRRIQGDGMLVQHAIAEAQNG